METPPFHLSSITLEWKLTSASIYLQFPHWTRQHHKLNLEQFNYATAFSLAEVSMKIDKSSFEEMFSNTGFFLVFFLVLVLVLVLVLRKNWIDANSRVEQPSDVTCRTRISFFVLNRSFPLSSFFSIINLLLFCCCCFWNMWSYRTVLIGWLGANGRSFSLFHRKAETFRHYRCCSFPSGCCF